MASVVIGVLFGLGVGIWVTLMLLKRRHDAPPDGQAELARLIGVSDKLRPDENSILIALEQDLRVKCMHHKELMERLIQAERDKTPNANREQLLRAAIRRWERSNK